MTPRSRQPASSRPPRARRGHSGLGDAWARPLANSGARLPFPRPCGSALPARGKRALGPSGSPHVPPGQPSPAGSPQAGGRRDRGGYRGQTRRGGNAGESAGEEAAPTRASSSAAPARPRHGGGERARSSLPSAPVTCGAEQEVQGAVPRCCCHSEVEPCAMPGAAAAARPVRRSGPICAGAAAAPRGGAGGAGPGRAGAGPGRAGGSGGPREPGAQRAAGPDTPFGRPGESGARTPLSAGPESPRARTPRSAGPDSPAEPLWGGAHALALSNPVTPSRRQQPWARCVSPAARRGHGGARCPSLRRDHHQGVFKAFCLKSFYS